MSEPGHTDPEAGAGVAAIIVLQALITLLLIRGQLAGDQVRETLDMALLAVEQSMGAQTALQARVRAQIELLLATLEATCPQMRPPGA